MKRLVVVHQHTHISENICIDHINVVASEKKTLFGLQAFVDIFFSFLFDNYSITSFFLWQNQSLSQTPFLDLMQILLFNQIK